MSTADEQAAWDGTTAAEDAEVVNAILPQMRALLAAKMLTIVERIAKRHFLAGYRRALEDAADALHYPGNEKSTDGIYEKWLRDRAAEVGIDKQDACLSDGELASNSPTKDGDDNE